MLARFAQNSNTLNLIVKDDKIIATLKDCVYVNFALDDEGNEISFDTDSHEGLSVGQVVKIEGKDYKIKSIEKSTIHPNKVFEAILTYT